MSLNSTELIGYVGSALVVASLTMTSVVKLRAISLVGAVAFVAYGALLESPPLVVTNVAIAGINVWFLRQELGGRRALRATVVPVDEPFLIDFLGYRLADIHRFQPGFALPSSPTDLGGGPGGNSVAMLLMRDGLPAGALLGRQEGADLHVTLDYVTKPFRDSQISQWLYGKGSGVFRRLGVERVISAPGADEHSTYLAKAGFTRVGDHFELLLGRRQTTG